MATYAILTGNQVTNVIVADTENDALAVSPKGVTAVKYTPDNPAGIGWTYDEATGQFTDPTVEVVDANVQL